MHITQWDFTQDCWNTPRDIGVIQLKFEDASRDCNKGSLLHFCLFTPGKGKLTSIQVLRVQMIAAACE
jgi:hypothetical protein